MTRMIAGLKESRSSSRGVNLGYSDRIELVLVGSRNPRALPWTRTPSLHRSGNVAMAKRRFASI